jgi:hypothetical protein
VTDRRPCTGEIKFREKVLTNPMVWLFAACDDENSPRSSMKWDGTAYDTRTSASLGSHTRRCLTGNDVAGKATLGVLTQARRKDTDKYAALGAVKGCWKDEYEVERKDWVGEFE